MAKLLGIPEVKLKMELELEEIEVRALEVLVSYDVNVFLKTFYETMGKGYLEKHEKGVRSLFEIRTTLNVWLRRTEDARKVFEGSK